ncbi:hypothetical protein VTO42DRAFT_1327 [Malbranchea cinnamomea]
MQGKTSGSLSKTEESPPGGQKFSAPAAKNDSASKVKPTRKRTKTGCLTCRKRRIKCGEEKPVCNNCIKSRRECEGYGQRVVFRPPIGSIPPIGPGPPIANVPGVISSTFRSHQSTYSVFSQEGAAGRPPFIPLAPRPCSYDGAQNAFPQSVSGSIQMQGGLVPAYSQPPPALPLGLNVGATGRSAPMDGAMREGPQEVEYPHITSGREQPDVDFGADSGAPSDWHPSQQFSTSYSIQLSSSLTTATTRSTLMMSESSSLEYRNSTGESGQSAHYSRGVTVPTKLQLDYFSEDEDEYDLETAADFDTEENSLAHHEPRKWAISLPFRPPNQGPQMAATFISYNNLLASYRPSPFSSPLLDNEAAQIFTHFITSVGPIMSVFERCPPVPSLVTSEFPVPVESKNLWTYTLPSLALEHPALMHAILATSSFHLAKMTGQIPTASFRHYHYAIRRIRKAVGLPHRRNQIATLAATLLLGYYEVMGAEHSKWCNHVAGGSQLIQETNFAALTRVVRDARARAKIERLYLEEKGFTHSGWGVLNDPFPHPEDDVDVGLISVLMGRPVNYDDFRHVSTGLRDYHPRLVLTEKDLEDYMTRLDLYWWYCKHDLYQSLISGNPLLMPYHRWGECPPRARLGDLDAAYGSFDHLVLLLARIAEFAAKDRKRKLKVIAANGGIWRPQPGMFTQGAQGGRGPPEPPGPNPGTPSGQANRESSPPMYGMAPSTPVRLPDGFIQTPSRGFASQDSEFPDANQDLDKLTADALDEWHEMLAACDEFENALGPGFQPLPPGTAPVIQTPFGPAIQYRTHIVASIWVYYYTSRILLHRVHPSMPPAAMAAAGVAAPQTAQYAQLIGRITGGVHTPQYPSIPVDVGPSVAGVLTELMIALFYAGVQFTNPAQRSWLIALMRDIQNLTGGRSASAVAGGCETAWIKAYEAGRGPPYERSKDLDYTERQYGVVSFAGRDRRFVMVSQGESIHLAMGLLSVEGLYPGRGNTRIVEEV